MIPSDLPLKKIDDYFLSGQRNFVHAIIVSPKKSDLKGCNKLSRRMEIIFEKGAQYHIDIEIGGWELSCLVPRTYFFFHKDIFRMESGKRIKSIHFCPTNPDTIRLIQKEAQKLFNSFPQTIIFHLWPDKNKEHIWCNCPACRAFSFAEQNIIALNAAADVLAKINPRAKLSYLEIETNTGEQAKIKPRENMFVMENPYNTL
jgi:hypothetical protein